MNSSFVYSSSLEMCGAYCTGLGEFFFKECSVMDYKKLIAKMLKIHPWEVNSSLYAQVVEAGALSSLNGGGSLPISTVATMVILFMRRQ